MEEETKKTVGLYINIDPNLKKNFYLKCVENDTNMSEKIIEIIKEYVNKK